MSERERAAGATRRPQETFSKHVDKPSDTLSHAAVQHHVDRTTLSTGGGQSVFAEIETLVADLHWQRTGRHLYRLGAPALIQFLSELAIELNIVDAVRLKLESWSRVSEADCSTSTSRTWVRERPVVARWRP
jgi:hypothetical protein